jgi:hypothetical protein
MATLGWYLTDTASLLRDAQFQFTTKTQLTRWINSGRNQVAKLTGCLRVLVPGQAPFGGVGQAGSIIPGGAAAGTELGPASTDTTVLPSAIPTNSFLTIPGVEKYSYAMANQYVRRFNAGLKGIMDVIDLSVAWGGIRPTLAWWPWEDLQAYGRSYNTGVTSYPFYWSVMNDGTNGQVWLFPTPSAVGEMEWDCTCLPLDLNSDGDYDAIPENFAGAVKFYAAGLSYLGSQRTGQAALMGQLFLDHLGIDRASSDRGKTPDFYFGSGIP